MVVAVWHRCDHLNPDFLVVSQSTTVSVLVFRLVSFADFQNWYLNGPNVFWRVRSLSLNKTFDLPLQSQYASLLQMQFWELMFLSDPQVISGNILANCSQGDTFFIVGKSETRALITVDAAAIAIFGTAHKFQVESNWLRTVKLRNTPSNLPLPCLLWELFQSPHILTLRVNTQESSPCWHRSQNTLKTPSINHYCWHGKHRNATVCKQRSETVATFINFNWFNPPLTEASQTGILSTSCNFFFQPDKKNKLLLLLRCVWKIAAPVVSGLMRPLVYLSHRCHPHQPSTK